MATTLQAPQPGDLITASFAKQLVDQLNSLNDRVAALEDATPGVGGKLTISQIDPTDVVVGDQIRITGTNFGVPAEDIVSFDGTTSVTKFLAGSSDRVLILTVPPVNLTGVTSRDVPVVVSGASGDASATVTVHAVQATLPNGTITVSPGTIPPNISPGGTFVIPFNVSVSANLDETYNLVPSVPTGSPAWSAVLVTNTNGTTEIPKPWQVPLAKASDAKPSTTTVFVKVSIPQGTTVTSPFVRLDVLSQLNPTALSSGFTAPIPFNQSQQPPQTVSFFITTTTPGGAGDTNQVSFAAPTPSAPPLNGVTYQIKGLKKANYTLKLEWLDTKNSNQGWTASFGGAPGIGNWPVTSKPLQVLAPGDDTEKVSIVGTQSATQNTLVMTVRSDDDPVNDYGILNQLVVPKT
jgi:hypothetical protein